MAKKKDKVKLKKELLKRQKVALQSEIGRRKLLQAVTTKKRVNVLARVEDKIPSVFVNGMHREEPRKQQSFLGRGRLI